MHKQLHLILLLPIVATMFGCSSGEHAASSPQPDSADEAESRTGNAFGDTPIDDAGTSSNDDVSVADASNSAKDCAAHPIDVEASDTGVTTFDIVSPERCTSRRGKLIECSIPPTGVHDPRLTSDGRFHSVVSSHLSGNCSSQFPLALKIDVGDPVSTIFHVEDRTMDVRKLDGAWSSTLHFTDSSPWTATAAYDASCRITIDVQMNVPDQN